MLELYTITDWNQGVASVVEAFSKSDAFRNYVLHTDVDMENLDQIDVDYRGPLSNRPYVEAEVELFHLGNSSKQAPLFDFADAMIDRWKEAEDKRQQTNDHLFDSYHRITTLHDEAMADNERLREERRELGGSNVVFKEQIDYLRHLVGHQEHEIQRLQDIVDEKPVEVIKITISGGCVADVENLPSGWDYELNDEDILDEPVPMTEWVDEFNGKRPE